MNKADDLMDDTEGGKEKYSNFGYLEAKVETLQEKIELIASILKQNNLVLKSETEVMETDIGDETFRKLEE